MPERSLRTNPGTEREIVAIFMRNSYKNGDASLDHFAVSSDLRKRTLGASLRLQRCFVVGIHHSDDAANVALTTFPMQRKALTIDFGEAMRALNCSNRISSTI